MNDGKHHRKPGSITSIVLYVFSGLALALGMLVLLLFISFARSVAGYDLFFQLAGLEKFAPVVIRPLQVGMIDLGILVFFLLLVMGILLFTAGKLVARQGLLAERVRVLEEKLRISDSQTG